MQEEIPEDKLAELQETLSNAADAASEVTELQDEASKARPKKLLAGPPRAPIYRLMARRMRPIL